jgi:hypothetical protein
VYGEFRNFIKKFSCTWKTKVFIGFTVNWLQISNYMKSTCTIKWYFLSIDPFISTHKDSCFRCVTPCFGSTKNNFIDMWVVYIRCILSWFLDCGNFRVWEKETLNKTHELNSFLRICMLL